MYILINVIFCHIHVTSGFDALLWISLKLLVPPVAYDRTIWKCISSSHGGKRATFISGTVTHQIFTQCYNFVDTRTNQLTNKTDLTTVSSLVCILTVSSQQMQAYPNGVYNPGQYSTNMLHPSNPFYCADQMPPRQPHYHNQGCPERSAGQPAPPPYPVQHCQGVGVCLINSKI